MCEVQSRVRGAISYEVRCFGRSLMADVHTYMHMPCTCACISYEVRCFGRSLMADARAAGASISLEPGSLNAQKSAPVVKIYMCVHMVCMFTYDIHVHIWYASGGVEPHSLEDACVHVRVHACTRVHICARTYHHSHGRGCSVAAYLLTYLVTYHHSRGRGCSVAARSRPDRCGSGCAPGIRTTHARMYVSK